MARLINFNMKFFVDAFEEMQKNDFDAIIIIDGNRGTGKSTLGFKFLSRIKCKNRFKPRKDICYSRINIIKGLVNKEEGCLLADEIVNVVYSRDHYEKEQKMLLKAFNMIRDSRNIFIGCIPSFAILDTQMRGLCKLRFTVVRRGIALVHLPKSITSGQDKWAIKETQKIENKWGKRGIIHPKYAQLPTVVGVLRFTDLKKKQKALYKQVKEEKRNRVLRDYEDASESRGDSRFDLSKLFYNRLYKRIKLKQLTPKQLNDICYVNGRKYKIVREELNNMLKKEGITTTLRDFVSNNNLLVEKGDLKAKKKDAEKEAPEKPD